MTDAEELQFHGLAIASTAGVAVEAIKKVDGQGHAPDWRKLIDLAMALIGAGSAFVAYAERMIERAQEADNG